MYVYVSGRNSDSIVAAVCRPVYLCMYVYLHTHAYIYQYIYVYGRNGDLIRHGVQSCSSMYTCVHIHVYICVYVFLGMYMFIYVYMHTYVHTYIYMCIYMYIYVYIYVNIYKYMYIRVRLSFVKTCACVGEYQDASKTARPAMQKWQHS